MAICIQCGKEFSTDKNTGFCSSKCRSAYIQSTRRPKTKKCVICGKLYQALGTKSKYCSAKCKSEALKIRNNLKNAQIPKPVKKVDDNCKLKKECYYGAMLVGNLWYCDYLEIEGKSKRHHGENCPHFKPKTKKRRHTSVYFAKKK